MPRGRHRHSPPLHRLLPPSAIAGVSVACAFAPWVFTEAAVLRGLAASAAATAVLGAVVLRRWDAQAGKQVADLTRARARDEWRYEDRVAELETDLEESRVLRRKLEQRLRAKRAELAGLRNEHAALLRRYATAETERASALEERRVLEIEAAAPARALPPITVPAKGAAAASGPVDEAGAVAAPAGTDGAEAATVEAAEESSAVVAVFSPEGSQLFLRAKAALDRFDGERSAEASEARGSAKDGESSKELTDANDSKDTNESQDPNESQNASDAQDPNESQESNGAQDSQDSKNASPVNELPGGESPKSRFPKGDSPKGGSPNSEFPTEEPPPNEPLKGGGPADDGAAHAGSGAAVAEGPGGSGTRPAPVDEAQGKPEAADGHERAAATTPAGAPATTSVPANADARARPALPSAQHTAGHFIAPTAVAVVPATPVRRPAIEGGFDFFGTQKRTEPSVLESVRNEGLADVVGEEALALNKAESEAELKPADAQARGTGQVIDLTAHDETEQIDVQGLRSAAS